MPVEKSVVDALNVHMGREFEAHLQYLSVSSWFDAEGLPELTKFFAAQAAEEHMHATKILAYVQDVGGPVVIPALAAPKAVVRERRGGRRRLPGVGGEHHRPHPLASSISRSPRSDHATQVFLQWYVTEQVEEIATMSELLQVTRRAGESNLLLLEDYVARPGLRAGLTRPERAAVDVAALASRPLRADDFVVARAGRGRLVRPPGGPRDAPALLRAARPLGRLAGGRRRRSRWASCSAW